MKKKTWYSLIGYRRLWLDREVKNFQSAKKLRNWLRSPDNDKWQIVGIFRECRRSNRGEAPSCYVAPKFRLKNQVQDW